MLPAWCPPKKGTPLLRIDFDVAADILELLGHGRYRPFSFFCYHDTASGSPKICTFTPQPGASCPINGTHSKPPRHPQHQDDPAAQQKPVQAVARADQPCQVAPFGAVIPHGDVQHLPAGQADAHFQPADGGSPPPPPPAAGRPGGRPAPAARTGRSRPPKNIVQWLAPRQASSMARYPPPPSRNSIARSNIQKPSPAYWP